MKVGGVVIARIGLSLLLLAADARATGAATPLRARGTFVSLNYALTFQAPDALTYCRLEEGWSGSDHGTVLFLTPPSACDGAGYPSSSRGFEPDTTARIEVYYGRWDGDDAASPPPACRPIGRVRFLGRRRPLCVSKNVGGMTVVEVSGHYRADSVAEASLTLVTTQGRLRHDLGVMRELVRTVRSCTIPWQDAEKRTRTLGTGHPCPAEGGFF